MKKARRVLAAVADQRLLDRVEELLLAARTDVGRALDQETAQALGFRQAFDLVISDFPLRGPTLAEFARNLRGPESLSPGCPVVLLGRSPYPAGEDRTPDGPTGIFRYTSTAGFLSAIAHQLDLANRVGERLLVQMEVTIDSARIQRAVQTENISTSGMLLRSQRLFPVGTILPFVLDLPLDPESVRGRAEVVRHAEPDNEGLLGMGVRFVELAGDAGERLGGFVAFSGAAPYRR